MKYLLQLSFATNLVAPRGLPFGNPAGQSVNSVGAPSTNNNPFEMNRSLNVKLISRFNHIDNYGCWCNFDSKWRKGQGNPVDVFDLECRNLIKGYECIYMDTAGEGGRECVPYDIMYLEPLNIRHFTDDQTIIDACTNQNNFGNDQDAINCRQRTCIVEAIFVRNLAIMSEQNIEPDRNSFRHSDDDNSNGATFDHELNCAITPAGPQDKECCGEYPFRYPYRVKEGDFQCCHNTTPYNVFLHECCDDGSTAISCS